MFNNKKRVPIVIVHDRSDSSDEEDREIQQPNSSLSTTSLTKNNINSACQLPFSTIINRKKTRTPSPDLDNLVSYSSSDSEEIELPVSTYFEEDSDNESGCGNMSTISTISSSTSSVYHSLEDMPNLPPQQIPTNTATTAAAKENDLTEVKTPKQDIITRENGVSQQQQQQEQEKVAEQSREAAKAIELMVHSDDEDMEISPEASDIEDEDEIEDMIITLNQLGITNEEEVKTIAKYCILKSGRLYCQFNPSSSTNRGCQINFAKKDIVQFKTHLSIFHQIETCEIVPTIVNDCISINKAVNTIKDMNNDDDNSSMNSLTELYGLDDVDQSTAPTTEDEGSHSKAYTDSDIKGKEYNPEEIPEVSVESAAVNFNDGAQQNDNDTNKSASTSPEESASTTSNEAPPQKPLTKAQKRRLKPPVSKVTPKVLRSTSRKTAPTGQAEQMNTPAASSSNQVTKEDPPQLAKRSSGSLHASSSPTVGSSLEKLSHGFAFSKSETSATRYQNGRYGSTAINATVEKVKLTVDAMKLRRESANENRNNVSSTHAATNLPSTQVGEKPIAPTVHFNLTKSSNDTVSSSSAPAKVTRNKGGRPKKKQKMNSQQNKAPITNSASTTDSHATTNNEVLTNTEPSEKEAAPTTQYLALVTTNQAEEYTNTTSLEDVTSESIITYLLSSDQPTTSISSSTTNTPPMTNLILPAVSVTPVTPSPPPINTSSSPASQAAAATTVEEEITNTNEADNIAPGTEAAHAIPAIPSDGVWPFQLGFGFFMRNKYHCNVTRSLGPQQSCKANFLNRSVFIQHLNYAHHLNETNAMTFRESEDDDNLGKYVADMMISTNLPSTVIKDKNFVEMVKAIKGPTDSPVVLPSLDRTRLLIQEEYEEWRLRIKQLLESQESISFSVHLWKPAKELDIKDSSMLIVTAFYIDDDTWTLKDVIIGFRSIKEGENEVIKNSLNEILESFNIINKQNTITCPDLNCTAPVEEQLENGLIPGIDTSVQLPCLDQIIETIKKRLFKRMKHNFTPLTKILEAIANFKDSPGPLASSFQRIMNNDDSSYHLLTEIVPIMDKYNSLCQSYPALRQFELDAGDQIKIREMLYLISTINQSADWLMNSTNYRYPTANKVYIICMELLDSIYKVARCYGCESINQIISNSRIDSSSDEDGIPISFSYSDKSMENVLSKMFMTLRKYKTTMEEVCGNLFWKSLVLDTFSFTAFKSQEHIYFKNVMNQISISAIRPETDEQLAFALKSQATEIEKILNGGTSSQAASYNTSPADLVIIPYDPAQILEATRKRQASAEENSVSETEDRFDEVPLKGSILRKKKRRLNETTNEQDTAASAANIPTTSPFQNFDMYITQFKNDQKVLLICNPSHSTRSSRADHSDASKTNNNNSNNNNTKNTALSEILYNEQNNFAQLSFWNNKKTKPDYYPRLRKLTKECFAVPTTSKESLIIAEEAKKHYIGLSCLYPDVSSQENQMRTLLHLWRKDNYTTTLNN